MSAANESTGDDQEHTPLRQGRERAEHFGGVQRCGAASFAKRWSWLLRRCRPHHLLFLSNNHSRPIAATLNTTMMLHGVDDAGSLLGVDAVGFASGVFDFAG